MSDIDAKAFTVKLRDMQSPARILEPCDENAADALAQLKLGSDVLVTFRRPRNIGQHKLLFALLRKVVENSDKWMDETVLLGDLKLATGLCEQHVSPLTGEVYMVPLSISFASLSQERFDLWFRKALLVLAEHLGTDPEILLAETQA